VTESARKPSWSPSASGPGGSGPARRLAVLALLVVASGFTVAALACPMPLLLRVLQDDGFYYVGIAVNWVSGLPSTFDGIQPTNGYHPLWQILALVPAWFVRDPEWLARTLMVIGVWMCVASAFLFESYLRRVGSSLAAGSLLWMTCAMIPAPIYGMETALAILACALCLAEWPVAAEHYTARRGAFCGLAAAALFLARLDTLPFLAAMALVAVFGQPRQRRSRWSFALPLIAVEAAAVLGYFASNWILWGHLASVSVLAKAGRTAPFHPWLIHLGTILGLALVTSLAALLWLVRRLRHRELGNGIPTGALWLALGTLGYMAVAFCAGGVETYGWYFGVVAASGAVLLPLWLDPGEAVRHPRLAQASWELLYLCLAATAWVLVLTWVKPVSFVKDYRVAEVLAHLPPGRLVFAATDCGIRGSVSRQHCLNLDGLTGSYEFQEALRDDRFVEWLRRVGLNCCFGPVEHVPASPTATTALWTRPGMNGVAREALLTVRWPAAYEAAGVSVYTVLAIDRPDPPPAGAPRGMRPPTAP